MIMAGDGQSDPKELKKLVEPILLGNADFVISSRLLGNCQSMPLTRYIGNKIFTLIINLLTRRRFTDVLSGYRALTKVVAKKLTITVKGYGLESEMLIKAAYHGFIIKEIPIKTIYEKNTSKMIPLVSWSQIFITQILTYLKIIKNRRINKKIKLTTRSFGFLYFR